MYFNRDINMLNDMLEQLDDMRYNADLMLNTYECSCCKDLRTGYKNVLRKIVLLESAIRQVKEWRGRNDY